jgi:ankyrin repeat protein
MFPEHHAHISDNALKGFTTFMRSFESPAFNFIRTLKDFPHAIYDLYNTEEKRSHFNDISVLSDLQKATISKNYAEILRFCATSQDVDEDGLTVFQVFGTSGWAYAVDLLIQHGADPGAIVANTHQRLIRGRMYAAIYKGDKESLKNLLAIHKHVDFHSAKIPKTLLMTAAIEEQIECMLILHQYTKNIDYANEGGSTALIYAVQFGKLKSVQALIQLGADPIKVKGSSDLTPLSIAVILGDEAIIKLLLSKVSRMDPAVALEKVSEVYSSADKPMNNNIEKLLVSSIDKLKAKCYESEGANILSNLRFAPLSNGDQRNRDRSGEGDYRHAKSPSGPL